VLTAVVRDLHAACPGQFLTDVRTAADPLWEHNPHLTRLSEGEPGVTSRKGASTACAFDLTRLSEGEPGVTVLDMQYPAIHQSNQRPYHFLHGYVQFFKERLGLRLPVTRFHGDIHLSAAEKAAPPHPELGIPERF